MRGLAGPILALSLAACAPAAGGRPAVDRSPGSLEVTHTALPAEAIPERTIERIRRLKLPYVHFYRTDVTNTTDRPVRVVWFDGFFMVQGHWVASNVRDRVLRTRDFLDWYAGDDLSSEGWLRPGGTATCDVNWHFSDTPDEIPVKWAYIAVDAHGHDYIGEAEVRNTTPLPMAAPDGSALTRVR